MNSNYTQQCAAVGPNRWNKDIILFPPASLPSFRTHLLFELNPSSLSVYITSCFSILILSFHQTSFFSFAAPATAISPPATFFKPTNSTQPSPLRQLPKQVCLPSPNSGPSWASYLPSLLQLFWRGWCTTISVIGVKQ